MKSFALDVAGFARIQWGTGEAEFWRIQLPQKSRMNTIPTVSA